MVERTKPQGILDLITLAIHSSYFAEQFAQTPQADRREFIAQIEEKIKALRRRSVTLTRIENQLSSSKSESSLFPSELKYPNRYIKRVFRASDGFLDFSSREMASNANSVRDL